MPTIFANTANPVFIPVSIFHQTMVEELRGVGGSNVKGYESKFSQNSHQYIPAQSLCFLTHYTATKNSFTLLEIVTSQEKIYGPSVHNESGSETLHWPKLCSIHTAYIYSEGFFYMFLIPLTLFSSGCDEFVLWNKGLTRMKLFSCDPRQFVPLYLSVSSLSTTYQIYKL